MYEAMRILFVRKENKNNDFIQQFLLFCVSLRRTFMDYFTDVLTTFLGLERVRCVAVYAGSESSRISSKIS